MNVRELIEELESMDPEAEVHFAYDYGDYTHTMVAPVVDAVDEMYVEPNPYVNGDALVDDEHVDKDNTKQRLVVVLS